MDFRSELVIYFLIGTIFGIVDWYIQTSLTSLGFVLMPKIKFANVVIFGLIYFVWLIPGITVAYVEVRKSMSTKMPVISVVTFWVGAIMGYYLYYLYLIVFVGLNQMEHLVITDCCSQEYWNGLFSIVKYVVFTQMFEWIPIAVVGGSLIGWIVAKVYLSLFKNSKALH